MVTLKPLGDIVSLSSDAKLRKGSPSAGNSPHQASGRLMIHESSAPGRSPQLYGSLTLKCSVGLLVKKDSKGGLKVHTSNSICLHAQNCVLFSGAGNPISTCFVSWQVRGFASGGPAERCGEIKVGMWLTAVDGMAVKGLQYTQLADLMQV